MIDRWLHCDECSHGELARVAAFEDRAVRDLGKRLRQPGGKRFESVIQSINDEFVLVPGGMSQAEYVRRMSENYVADYQIRSASALAAIGTPRAREVLRRALADSVRRGYRADVKRALERAINEAAFGAFDGFLSSSSVRFGDTVSVRRGWLAFDTAGNVTHVSLPGSPFADSLVIRKAHDTLWFIAAARRGEYRLLIKGLGPLDSTRTAPFSITSLRPPHPANAPAAVTSVGYPKTFFIALGATAADSAAHYRFEPASDLQVTASAEVVGLISPQIIWSNCSMGGIAMTDSILSGRVVDERGAAVEGVAVNGVTAAGQAATATTNAVGEFEIVGTSSPSTRVAVVTVAKAGFRTWFYAPLTGSGRVLLSIVRDTVSEDAARRWYGANLRIPGGQCRILRVKVPGAAGIKIVRLRLTSP
ncbi:MAG: hypothetical protein ACRENP_23400 [Longimicrobiales bacterium]